MYVNLILQHVYFTNKGYIYLPNKGFKMSPYEHLTKLSYDFNCILRCMLTQWTVCEVYHHHHQYSFCVMFDNYDWRMMLKLLGVSSYRRRIKADRRLKGGAKTMYVLVG